MALGSAQEAKVAVENPCNYCYYLANKLLHSVPFYLAVQIIGPNSVVQ